MTTYHAAVESPTEPSAAYPPSAPMRLSFDVDALRADLDLLRRRRWRAQRAYSQDGTAMESGVDWRILPLRSVGGDPVRTDPGGPGLADFADTPWLDDAPALAQVIDALPAPVRGVRLMALGAGATVHEHRDYKYGFERGLLRLHVPIDTNPDAVVVIDGVSEHWTPGRLWFGDFGRRHYVANHGDRARVHMVLDCLVSREVVGLLPDEFRELLPLSEVMFARDPVPLTAAERDRLCCRFRLPGDFAQWSEEEVEARPDSDAAVLVHEDRLVLAIDGEPAFGLVHLGLGEFRLTGWSEERTIAVESTGQVRIRERAGRALREWTRPAQPVHGGRTAPAAHDPLTTRPRPDQTGR
ncbi:aspartyl/asparaginyl beta-hydroxylase domain-containing protein [Actinomadura geliboluensis]|uniref:Aspartyl/asparaginyl beta-hydroxylase domain-containing protein n=1 Tax=Actinomadura geliboluensis TaxID=882440 RepID=A0A5S4GVA6_9ACTN|nr:aspartyl/asparaginyl beta-hydroxylase domain-containing protein [Actinomadura geliboluensis]TMR36883.1 aspartyl/asparaginyl beta-hydroxylase domain-containing protein [Actinomadura geliboluensis]